jgi:TonB family protein
MRSFIVLLALLLASTLPAVGKRYSEAEWKAMFSERPWPNYPQEFRARHLTGTGYYRLYVDEHGEVKTIGILRSTHHPELDLHAMRTFLRWRAVPVSTPKIREVDMEVSFKL